MSDPTPPTPAPTPQATKRSLSPIDKKIVKEIDLAEQLVAVAGQTDYATALAGEEIDAAFLAALTQKITDADQLIGQATGSSADKESDTQDEEGARQSLLANISKVQKRAKRKYGPKDPARKKYFIGEAIEASRPMLEGSANSIVQTLVTDTLPGHKAADTTALSDALKAYKATQTAQSGDASGSASAHALLKAKTKDIADDRRQIQYAADTLWPAGDPANVGARKAFGLPPNKALK